jgi:hypothetical protein
MKRRAAVAAAMLVLSCLCCSGPVITAVGESDDLVVIVDGEASRATRALVSQMEVSDSWLLGEQAFRTTVTTPSEAGDLRNRRNVLVLGTWDGGEVRKLVRRSLRGLDPRARPALHIREDVWAKGQVVGAIMGRNQAELLSFLKGQNVLYDFERASVGGLARNLCERSAQSGVDSALAERYGWSLCLPPGYELFEDSTVSGFVFFRRARPDRSLFVYWQPGQRSDLTQEFVIAKRQELARRYYDGDEIEWRRPLEIGSIEFAGTTAIRVSGWWANTELVGGGPFRSYCLHDTLSARTYIVDVSLFAPGLEKVPLMRNLDAIASTFKTALDVGD